MNKILVHNKGIQVPGEEIIANLLRCRHNAIIMSDNVFNAHDVSGIGFAPIFR